MFLRSLILSNFKNYQRQAFEFSPQLNCLVGLNGVGKTNVLDAVHFLCLCKSHSGLNDRNLVRHGADFFRIEGRFGLAEGGSAKVTAKYQGGQRKEIEKNGVVFDRLSDYIGQSPVVMIAPDDVALVQDGSEDRRRFLDATLSQISSEYLQSLLVYNALLKQRNALLKSFFELRRFDADLLESLDRQMLKPAELIYAQRSAFVAEFRPLLESYYSAISGSKEEVSIAHDADMEGMPFSELLARAQEKDRLLQRSTVGPHRDDLVLEMDGQALKKFASQGQLKSFLLAMRLAQYELLRNAKGVSPILLLDDIFDKLDAQRVSHLVGLLLSRSFGQIFITDTQRERLESILVSFAVSYKVFEVQKGKSGEPEVQDN